MRTHVRLWTPYSCFAFSLCLALAVAAPVAAQPQPKLRFNLGEKDKGRFQSLAFSPDGKTLASEWLGTKVKIYDHVRGRQITEFDAHKATWIRLAYHPSGKILASAGGKTVKLWDTADYKISREIKTDAVNSIAISPDGKVMASGGKGTIKLWDPETGKDLATLTGNKDLVHTLVFSHDSKTLASVGVSAALKLYDVATRKETLTVPVTMLVRCVVFSPDDKTLACGGQGKGWHKVEMWDLAEGKSTTLFHAASGGGFVKRLALTPDGKTLVTGEDLSSIHIRSAVTGRAPFIVNAPGAFTEMVLSPDGQTLAAGGNHIVLWDLVAAKKK